MTDSLKSPRQHHKTHGFLKWWKYETEFRVFNTPPRAVMVGRVHWRCTKIWRKYRGTGRLEICTSASMWILRMYSLVVCFTTLYGGADKSLARSTSRCILFDGENIFYASFVTYTNSTNISPIMIIK